MGDKRKTESWVVRTPPGMKDRLATVAAQQGVDRNKLVVRALERTLGIQHVDDELPAEAHVSPHPKDREDKVMSGKTVMLVRCGECGIRLR